MKAGATISTNADRPSSDEGDGGTTLVHVALERRELRHTLLMIALTIIALLVVLWAWGLLSHFLFNILLAWLVVISFDPVVRWLDHHGLSRGLATALAAIVGFLVFAIYFTDDAPRIKRFVLPKLALATLSAAAHVGFFYLIDVPYWLPMGIFAAVVSLFIPTIGTYIGVALPALFAVFDDPIDVLWIVIFASVYQQVENCAFTPRISTKAMDIDSGVALAAVFVGAAPFGPIGRSSASRWWPSSSRCSRPTAIGMPSTPSLNVTPTRRRRP